MNSGKKLIYKRSVFLACLMVSHCSGKNSDSRGGSSQKNAETDDSSSTFLPSSSDDATIPEVLAGAYLTVAYQENDDGRVAVRVNLEKQNRRFLQDLCRHPSVRSAVWELRDAGGLLVVIPTEFASLASACSRTTNLVSLSGGFDMTWFASRGPTGAYPKVSPKLVVRYRDGVSEGEKIFEISKIGPDPTPAAMDCPENFVFIPANPTLQTLSFCVMKYEAKKTALGGTSFVARSQALGLPWTGIARGTDGSSIASAWKACRDLGNGYDLISNAQWQAIARNIESVPQNWSSGAVGAGDLNQGDSKSMEPLSAVEDDDKGCVGIEKNTDNLPTDSCGSKWHPSKRTHILSTGGILWDLSGNVWEWVSDDNHVVQCDSSVPQPYISQLALRCPGNELKWLPLGNYSALNRDLFGGLGFMNDAEAGAVMRGGAYNSDSTFKVGVFSANLGQHKDQSAFQDLGFRCTFSSPLRSQPSTNQ